MAFFFCDMSVFSAEERARHLTAISELFGAVVEIRESADGYAFRLDNRESMLTRIASFVEDERLCCPFFGYRIDVEPNGGPIWLSVTGPDDIKPFIRAEFGTNVPDELALRCGFR